MVYLTARHMSAAITLKACKIILRLFSFAKLELCGIVGRKEGKVVVSMKLATLHVYKKKTFVFLSVCSWLTVFKNS
jgi:hypothetical protein